MKKLVGKLRKIKNNLPELKTHQMHLESHLSILLVVVVVGFGGLIPGGVGLWCCCWPFVVVIWCVLTCRCAGGGHLLSLWSCGSFIRSIKFAKLSKKKGRKKPTAQDTYASQVIDVWGVVVAVYHHCHHFVSC